tara:strand:- start:1669 stop:2058 length:390 start_codon:yes stop_codon:yes gene_type:complete
MRKYPNQFQKVVDFLNKNGIVVSLRKSTCFTGWRDGNVFIHHNYNLEKNGLYALLHEAGHVLQTDNEFGPNHYRKVDDMEKPKQFNMYRFINENEAWDSGLALADELGLKINLKEFHKQKEEALLTYYV